MAVTGAQCEGVGELKTPHLWILNPGDSQVLTVNTGKIPLHPAWGRKKQSFKNQCLTRQIFKKNLYQSLNYGDFTRSLLESSPLSASCSASGGRGGLGIARLKTEYQASPIPYISRAISPWRLIYQFLLHSTPCPAHHKELWGTLKCKTTIRKHEHWNQIINREGILDLTH